MGKGNSSKVNEIQGFLTFGAFKLDHLQPVELILFLNFSTIITQFLLTKRGRKAKAGAENGERKLFQSK